MDYQSFHSTHMFLFLQFFIWDLDSTEIVAQVYAGDVNHDQTSGGNSLIECCSRAQLNFFYCTTRCCAVSMPMSTANMCPVLVTCHPIIPHVYATACGRSSSTVKLWSLEDCFAKQD